VGEVRYPKYLNSYNCSIVLSKAIPDCWIGIIGSTVFSGKLSILENLLHLVNLFYTSNLKVWFAL
jgi:hypothetical protein